MPVIPLFLCKLSVSLGLVWCFYQVFLRRLTFYKLNRWYLLGYTLLSCLIPFINIGPMLPDGPEGEPIIIQFIPAIGPIGEKFVLPAGRVPALLSVWTVLLMVLAAGALGLLIRAIVRWMSLVRLRRSARLIDETGIKIYQVDGPIIPFSFGNAIYINQRLHTEKEWEDIVLHEFVHIRQRHTVDILIAELICILNWYNPFAWLIRYSVRQNLEFIADQQVLDNGADRKGYQYHLLKVVGEPRYRLANNFNFSSLKKRIVMMNKMRSARLHLLKLLFLLPLVAVLLTAFRDRYVGLFRADGPVFVNAAGIVINSADRRPLEGVVVRDRETGLEAKTDGNGYYKIRIPARTNAVNIYFDYTKPGYDTDFRERSIGQVKENMGVLDVAVLHFSGMRDRAGIFIAPASQKAPVDPDYGDAERELHRVLAQSDDVARYMQMQKGNPDIALFYYTEDKLKALVIHKGGAVEWYGYPGKMTLAEMEDKYGYLPYWMKVNDHPVNAGYLARWAAIAERAQRDFHSGDPDIRQVIFPGDSRVIVLTKEGYARTYDMDNQAESERAEFERLYGKLPDCVPAAGMNSDEFERRQGMTPRHSGVGGNGVAAAGSSGGSGVSGSSGVGGGSGGAGIAGGAGRSGGAGNSGGSGSSGGAGRSAGVGATDTVPGVTKRPLYVVDGKPKPDGWRIEMVDPNTIKSIDIISANQAVQEYGERAINGAVIVIMKGPGQDSLRVRKPVPTLIHRDSLAQVARFVGGDPLFVIDGVEVPKDSLHSLDPYRIKEMQVLKDSAAIAEYGERGRYGVIKIKTKGVGFDDVALYIVDGREMGRDSARLLNKDQIGTVNVLKPEAARAIYGEKAKNGAILITLKHKSGDSGPTGPRGN
jgi:beta-lactamase regulating signal transducer with metallopeptidase domain